ncbi:helix-turn-helix domain-containing protein [Acidovorax sp. Root217]|uniref:helix-turn-helix domain-containing protein n=1 Tax=Acidovorax sp. Root217 TaxID=1736492 RepID=UPI001F2DA51D|nr:AraC family transcriptional regulator [Acidovorax sp. Root217]
MKAAIIPSVHSIVYHGISAAPGAAAFTVELLARAPYSARDDAGQASFGIALERQRGVHAIGTDRREDFDTWVGTMSFTPPGLDVFSESATGGEYLAARWDASRADAGQPATRPQRTAPPALLQQALALRGLLVQQAPPGQVEALVQALLAGLDAVHAAPARPQALAALRPLYARVLERIDDEIGHPDEDLSLAALSAQVQHTPLAFLRHFKQLTGMTPHAYVNERRLQRVRRALEDPRNALADAAALAGYASQSHMGTAVQRAFRLTPVGYQARAHAGSCAPG